MIQVHGRQTESSRLSQSLTCHDSGFDLFTVPHPDVLHLRSISVHTCVLCNVSWKKEETLSPYNVHDSCQLPHRMTNRFAWAVMSYGPGKQAASPWLVFAGALVAATRRRNMFDLCHSAQRFFAPGSLIFSTSISIFGIVALPDSPYLLLRKGLDWTSLQASPSTSSKHLLHKSHLIDAERSQNPVTGRFSRMVRSVPWCWPHVHADWCMRPHSGQQLHC